MPSLQNSMANSPTSTGIAIENLNDDVLRAIFGFAEAAGPVQQPRGLSLTSYPL
jgi:hypothetical protein